MMFWRKVMAITWKDVISEFRAREIIVSVLVFTLLVIITFNFAFGCYPSGYGFGSSRYVMGYLCFCRST